MSEPVEKSYFDLLVDLGTELVGKQAVPRPPNQLAELGKRWLTANSKKLREVVCEARVTKAVLNGKDSIVLVTAVADLIAGAFSGVSPFTVAALLVKFGLDRLCSGERLEF